MGPWDSLVGKCTCPQAWQLEFHVVVGWMRMSPIRPGVWKLGSQLLELFGGVACWRRNVTAWVLRVYSFIPFPFCSVCVTFGVKNIIAQILALTTSCHASTFVSVSPGKLFLHKMLLIMVEQLEYIFRIHVVEGENSFCKLSLTASNTPCICVPIPACLHTPYVCPFLHAYTQSKQPEIRAF